MLLVLWPYFKCHHSGVLPSGDEKQMVPKMSKLPSDSSTVHHIHFLSTIICPHSSQSDRLRIWTIPLRIFEFGFLSAPNPSESFCCCWGKIHQPRLKAFFLSGSPSLSSVPLRALQSCSITRNAFLWLLRQRTPPREAFFDRRLYQIDFCVTYL